jgi:tape measure domain-containing protein
MSLDTAIKFTAKLEGQGLDQLKRGLQGMAQQANRSSKDLDQLYNANKKLSQAAGQSINSLNRQVQVLTNLRNEAALGSRQFKFYSAELDKLQRQQAKLTSTSQGGGLLALGGGLGGLAAAAGGALAVKFVADVGLQAESAQVRLQALAGEFGEYNQAQEAAARIAQALRISNTEATQSFASLYASLRPTGITIQELEKAFIGFSAAARNSGATAQETSNALIQLKQGLASGVLQGEELRSIREQAPLAAQAIARELGVSIGELKELASQGKVTTDVVLSALGKLQDQQLGKLNAQFKTGAQALTDLQNELRRTGEGIAKAFGPTAIAFLRGFTAALQRVSDALNLTDGAAERQQDRIRATFQAQREARERFGVGGVFRYGFQIDRFQNERRDQLFNQFQAERRARAEGRPSTTTADQQAARDAAAAERQAARDRASKEALEEQLKIRKDAEDKLADAAQRNVEQLADFQQQTIKRAAELERQLGDQRLELERTIGEVRRRIAEQEQDAALEAERQRLRAAGLSTEGIDAARELGEISRRYSEQRIQNEQNATDRQVQLQRQLEEFKASVADGVGKIQEGYARSVSRILQDAGDKLAEKMQQGAQAAAGTLTGAPGAALGPSTLRSGSVRGGQLNVGTLVGLAKAAGFNDRDARIMAAIAMAESGGRSMAHNPNAATGDNSYGLWQVNMLGRMGPERRRQFGISRNEQLFDPATNAQAARQVFQSQGFGAWSVFRSGAYKQFLPGAMQAQPMAAPASGGAPAGFNSAGLMGGLQRAGQQLGGAIGTERAVKDQQAFNDLFNAYLGKFGEYKADLDGVTRSAKQQLEDQQRIYELQRSGLSPELAKQQVELENTAKAELERLEALEKALDLELQRADLTDQQRQQLKDLRGEVIARQMNEQGITEEIKRQQQALEELNRREQALADLTQSIGSTLSNGIIGGIDAAIGAAMNGAEGLEDQLKQIASGVLKDIGMALIRFGLNSLLGGIQVGGQSLFKFADGGVMSNAGPMPLRRYAGGGVANSPQMALFGERGPEAYVPLPDGRSIPVKMQQRSDALNRYKPMGATGTMAADGEMAAAGGGGAAGSAAIDVRYTVERINNVEYVTAEQFRAGLQQAAAQGAQRGQQLTLRRLQQSPGTRRRVGI